MSHDGEHDTRRVPKLYISAEDFDAKGAVATMVYDPYGEDAQAVKNLEGRPSVITVPIPFAGHGIIFYLAQSGLLSSMLDDFLAGRLAPPQFSHKGLASKATECSSYGLYQQKAGTI